MPCTPLGCIILLKEHLGDLAGMKAAIVGRSVPVLTQLFVIYFGLAAIGIRLSPIPAAIVGFGINGGAYLTEVFRASSRQSIAAKPRRHSRSA